MPRIRLFISLFIALSVMSIKAQCFSYDIYWHCSFVNELAAFANVEVNDCNGNFSAVLEGRTRNIGGINYCINDTLQSTFSVSAHPTVPASETVQYISGYYRKPHAGRYEDLNAPNNYRTISGQGYLSADNATVECVTLTADMLCTYYYAKTVDFENMVEGVAHDVSVFMPDGSMRTLRMTYNGSTEYNGQDVYDLTLNFTYGDGWSSYPISVYIDPIQRIPLRFAASIAIGDVQMVYRP